MMSWLNAFIFKVFNFLRPQQEEKTQLLLQTKLFNHLDDQQIDKIARAAKFVTFNQNKVIVEAGSVANYFYVIKAGEVRSYVKNNNDGYIVAARLGENDYFSEQALLPNDLRQKSNQIISITPVTLLRLNHYHYMQVLKSRQSRRKKINNSNLLDLLIDDATGMIAGEVFVFHDGDIIFKKNDQPDYMYIVISGKVKIILDELHPDAHITVNKNQLFGELGLLKKQPRSGTAIAVGVVNLLGVKNTVFDDLYLKSPQLREFIGALTSVYETTKHGVVATFNGKFEGFDSVCAAFNLKNGEVVLSYQVIGGSIYSISYQQKHDNLIILTYKKNKIFRELATYNNTIISIKSYGVWDELPKLSAMLLDKSLITAEQIIAFKRTGNLGLIANKTSLILCRCMNVSRENIKGHICEGVNNLDALCKITGAGTVCGSCRPLINEMIGKSSWFLAKIIKSLEISDDIRVFQFKLVSDAIPDYQPGQSIIIQGLINDYWIERAYTLTSISQKDQYLEVIIKKEPMGVLSTWMFNVQIKDALIRISQPSGNFTLARAGMNPIVFFAAGIGVTPALSFARYIDYHHSKLKMYIDYSTHSASGMYFKNEINHLVSHSQYITFSERQTQVQGRITQEEIKKYAAISPHAEYYICGPGQFNRDIRSSLMLLGVHEDKIHIELFKQAGVPGP